MDILVHTTVHLCLIISLGHLPRHGHVLSSVWVLRVIEPKSQTGFNFLEAPSLNQLSWLRGCSCSSHTRGVDSGWRGTAWDRGPKSCWGQKRQKQLRFPTDGRDGPCNSELISSSPTIPCLPEFPVQCGDSSGLDEARVGAVLRKLRWGPNLVIGEGMVREGCLEEGTLDQLPWWYNNKFLW